MKNRSELTLKSYVGKTLTDIKTNDGWIRFYFGNSILSIREFDLKYQTKVRKALEALLDG